MSDSPKTEEKPAAPAKAKSNLVPAIIGAFLTALLAGGAAFGGAKYGGAHAVIMPPAPAEHESSHDGMKPPGPTLPLEPFLVNVTDAGGKTHAMKVTIAVEFEKAAKEEEFKILVPRIRDAALAFFRALSFEQAQKPEEIEKAKKDLLEKIRSVGAEESRKVLVTDLVVQ